MKTTSLTIILMLFSMFTFAQDWTGFYTLNIDENGYKGTLQAQIYQLNGEYWGQLRGYGNEAFGEKWEIEFWTIVNEGGSIDAYYDQGNDDKFPNNNALLFALVGNKAKFTTTFSTDLTNAVQYLQSHEGFYLDMNEGEITEFTAVETAAPPKQTKPNNTEVTTPAKPAAVLTVPTLTVSKSDFIVGKWHGEEASDFTKFFDYDFHIDGTGKRGNSDFNWSITTEGGKDYLDLQYFKPITASSYRSYLAQADNIENREGIMIFKTSDGKTHQIKISGEHYAELENTTRYGIALLDDKSLALVLKYNGKEVKTLHYKE